MKNAVSLVLITVTIFGCSGKLESAPRSDASDVYTVHQLMRQRCYRQAQQLCKELIETDHPVNEFLLSQLGQANLSLGEREAGREVFERLLRINPQSREARYFLRQVSKQCADAGTSPGEAPESPQLPDPLSLHAMNANGDGEHDGSSGSPTKRHKVPERPKRNFAGHTSVSAKQSNATAVQVLQQELRRARHLDQEFRARKLLEGDKAIALDDADIPVTNLPAGHRFRADLGLGLPVDTRRIVPPSSTTGRNVARLDWHTIDEHGGALVEQALPQRLAAPTPYLNCVRPSWRPLPEVQLVGRPQPQCMDGRDNNANLLIDRRDPVCWADPNDPTTYSPHFSELVDVPASQSTPQPRPLPGETQSSQ